jgi:hypothetical protein
MLEFPPEPGAEGYLIEVKDANTKQVVYSQTDKSNAHFVSVLSWGKSYAWRYAVVDKTNQPVKWFEEHHFSIQSSQYVSEDSFRVRVFSKTNETASDGLIMLDYARVAINRMGKPVWFLPEVKGEFEKNMRVRDLRLTKYGTVTFLTDKNAYEVDMDGNILWKTPPLNFTNYDAAEVFHHDFKKLDNGNYMVLCTKMIQRPVPASFDLKLLQGKPGVTIKDGVAYANIKFGMIMEYDKQGKIVWSWSSETYLTDKDLFSHKNDDGTPDFSTHLNAFSSDNTGRYIYAGFRDLSRVIKIDKTTGKVVYSWGEKMPSGEAADGDGFFRSQHDAQGMPGGDVGVFNNGSARDSVSSIVVFTEPSEGGKSQIKWQYNCDIDDMVDKKSTKMGNIDILPESHIFCCMGAVNRLFEVTLSKLVVWSALVENSVDGKIWTAFPQYRAHFAKSFYPYYFTASTNKNELKGKGFLKITVNNDGTEPDKYRVEITTKQGTYDLQSTSPVLSPGQSHQFNILPVKAPVNEEVVTINIYSDTNRAISRQVIFKSVP